jgi:hypothetical protein
VGKPMPTRLPERRPQAGLNSWHVAGICIGFSAILVFLAWTISNRGRPLSGEKPVSGITTGIAPAGPKAN